MTRDLTQDDQGKPVVDQHGEQIGTVVAVTEEGGQVAPTDDDTDTPLSVLEESEGGVAGLTGDDIEEITEDEVRVRL